MKIHLFTIFFLLMGSLQAQIPGGIAIKAAPDPPVLHGNSIPVTLTIDFQPRSLGKRSVLILKPTLRYNNQIVPLEDLLFKGEKVKGAGKMVSYAEGLSVSVRDTVSFAEGMERAELVVQPLLTERSGSLDPGQDPDEMALRAVARDEIIISVGVITTGRRFLHNERILPAPEKYRESQGDSRMANLFFGKDDWSVDPDLPMNRIPFVQQQLEMLFAPLEAGWLIDTVIITAYTSPEGDSLYNEAIAKQRAASGERYVRSLLDTLSIGKEVVFVENVGGEDWEGLSKTLKASALPGKEKIIDIINNQPNTDKRLDEIMQQTQLFQDVETTFLPLLRRISIRIIYSEPYRSDQDILELAIEKPASLLFGQLMYAATLTSDTEQQLRIYGRANALYPEEWEAPHNAAYIYLQRDRPEEAIVYLNQAQNLFPFHGVTLNNLAAASLMLERPDKAHQYLDMAEKEGIDVSYNRGICYLLEGEYEKAATVFEDFDCDINAGLAALMTDRIDQAVSKLTCAPETAACVYLLAIAEARNGNKKTSAGYLSQAIALDPEYKIIASNDIEFQKYRSEDWFQTLTEP